jgi:hypothetical protein
MIPVIGQLVSGVLGALQAIGYPGIATIVGLESMGLPMPGETTLIAASYLAATGHFSLPLVICSAALGAIICDPSATPSVARAGGASSIGMVSTFASPRRSSRRPTNTSPATVQRRCFSDDSFRFYGYWPGRSPARPRCPTTASWRPTSPVLSPGRPRWGPWHSSSASRWRPS